MSERMPQNPEASKQTVVDLYDEAAHYLETMLGAGRAVIEPAASPYQLRVSCDVVALNGKTLHLEYDRARDEESPTEVDEDVPLTFADEASINHWWTPISVRVYDAQGSLLHAYDVSTAEDVNTAIAYDRKGIKDPLTGDLPTITALDAREIMAHLEWALDPQDQL